MLMYFEPASMCNLPTDLVIAPLPARKQLWEARDESTWTRDILRESSSAIAFGLARDGELVVLGVERLSRDDVWLSDQPPLETSPRSTASWEEWCSGIDGFGGLIMLAASLVG
jgi:hypothetical protein